MALWNTISVKTNKDTHTHTRTYTPKRNMLYIHGSAQDCATQVRHQWSYGGSEPSHQPAWTKDLLILLIQYHGCWCPGDTRSQGISSHGIDPNLLEYSCLAPDELTTPWACSYSSSSSLNIHVITTVVTDLATITWRGWNKDYQTSSYLNWY